MEKSMETGKKQEVLSTEKSLNRPDYGRYRFKNREKLIYMATSMGIMLTLSYLFYDSLFPIVLSVPLYVLLLKIKEPSMREKQKLLLCSQFREAILSVAAALNAGYSIENAFRQSQNEIEKLYGKKSLMWKELNYMTGKMSVNIPIEELLADFADRSNSLDINTFCQVFIFAKRGGGDFSRIIKNTADRIGEKNALKREIDTELSSRRYESRAMCIMPMFIIGYVRLSTPDYFDVLYHNPAGIAIMTGVIALYGASYALSEKIMNIAV